LTSVARVEGRRLACDGEELAVSAEPCRVLDLYFESACRLLKIADTHWWGATADENIKHDAERPDVDFWF